MRVEVKCNTANEISIQNKFNRQWHAQDNILTIKGKMRGRDWVVCVGGQISDSDDRFGPQAKDDFEL